MDYRKKDGAYQSFDEIREGSKKSFEDYMERNFLKPAEGWEDLFKIRGLRLLEPPHRHSRQLQEQMVMMQQVWAATR
jgi:hypothetical protein